MLTGSRAEYGLLYWLMKEIDADPELELQLVVTGAHLSPEFGATFKIIEKDGFAIDEKVEMLLSSDTAVGIAKSIGLATIGFADAFIGLENDKGNVIVNNERAKVLAICMDCMIIDVSKIKNVKIDDEVILWDNINITLENWGELCKTSNYEVLSGLSRRIFRILE